MPDRATDLDLWDWAQRTLAGLGVSWALHLWDWAQCTLAGLGVSLGLCLLILGVGKKNRCKAGP